MSESEGPIRNSSQITSPGERPIDKPELPKQGVLVEQFADTETIAGEGMLKVGRHRHFEFLCDEPPGLGGANSHPQPLTYICAGVGF